MANSTALFDVTLVPNGLQGSWGPVVSWLLGASLAAWFLFGSLSRKPSHLKDAPGPPGYPIIGHMPALMNEGVHRIVTEVHMSLIVAAHVLLTFARFDFGPDSDSRAVFRVSWYVSSTLEPRQL